MPTLIASIVTPPPWGHVQRVDGYSSSSDHTYRNRNSSTVYSRGLRAGRSYLALLETVYRIMMGLRYYSSLHQDI